MNKVDRVVKNLLLEYPTLYKTRTDVLYNIFFCNGAGYEWDDQGCIYNRFGTPSPEAMKFDDLDSREAELAEDIAKNADVPYMKGFYLMQKAEIETERATRKIRETYIDVYASEKGSDARISYGMLDHFYVSEWGILATAPYGNIDKDWLAALDEILDVVRLSFNKHFSLHYDTPLKGEKAPEPSMFSRMPEKFQKMWTFLLDVEAKSEAQSGRRARMRAAVEEMLKTLKD